MVCDLAPLWVADLTAEWWHKAVATDASPYAEGLCYTAVTPSTAGNVAYTAAQARTADRKRLPTWWLPHSSQRSIARLLLRIAYAYGQRPS